MLVRPSVWKAAEFDTSRPDAPRLERLCLTPPQATQLHKWWQVAIETICAGNDFMWSSMLSISIPAFRGSKSNTDFPFRPLEPKLRRCQTSCQTSSITKPSFQVPHVLFFVKCCAGTHCRVACLRLSYSPAQGQASDAVYHSSGRVPWPPHLKARSLWFYSVKISLRNTMICLLI